MLRFENVCVKFDEQTVIDDLSFELEEGHVYGITGASGIGKTTIINVLAGLVHPKSGNVFTDDKKIGYIFQEPRLFPWLTALENVEAVCNDKQKAPHYLELLLPDSTDKYPDELSGGMKQRVSIARALAYEPDVLLLDEPFKGLDGDTKKRVMSAVSDYLRGKTAILITHDSDELEMCDTVFHLENAPVTSLFEVKSGSASRE
jgi:ABC-type nitrate/sulfonate/bicarbonate transport system ATPase subunit